MTSAFIVNGGFRDNWLSCDSSLSIQGGGSGSVVLTLFLPRNPLGESYKTIYLTDGTMMEEATLKRGQRSKISFDLAEGATTLRILCAPAESTSAKDPRTLGVRLIDITCDDESLVIEPLPENEVAEVPVVPGYWALKTSFDPAYYVKQVGAPPPMEPLVHYLTFGWQRKLDPTPDFDTAYYCKQLEERDLSIDDIPPYVHYLTEGRALGLLAKRSRKREIAKLDIGKLDDAVFLDRTNALIEAVGLPAPDFSVPHFSRFALRMFDATAYRTANGLPTDLTEAELLTRYLVFDFPRGIAPGPLFDADFYRDQIEAAGMRPAEDETLFQHWVRCGISKRISPTLLFDEATYLALNPDLDSYPSWLFDHWIMHGLREERPFILNGALARNRLWNSRHDVVEQTGARGFALRAARTPGMAAALQEMHDFRTSEAFDALIDEANAIDPNVGGIGEQTLSLVPPLHDEHYALLRRILDLLPKAGCEALVLMPFCKLGGADFVASVLSRALTEAGERTVILRTEQSDWERPDWFPEGIVTLDISQELGDLPPRMQSRALYDVVRYLRPRAVFNVNSRRAFAMIDGFGERLKLFTRLYSYYFCADRTLDGYEAGYPVWYFASILQHLDGALVDTQFLADTLIRRHGLNGSHARRVKVVHTPAMHQLNEMPELNTIDGSGSRVRQVILWAGRFDRQKRFDLLLDIARAMPEVDFRCWGKAVLDKAPELSDLPENLELNPPFTSYKDLPLDACDGWLYTSAWDGMPTILIELASMGVPVVASAVGGVPELIDAETGWPVSEAAGVEDYVVAIQEMLSDPDERAVRAAALKRQARERHVFENFQERLRAILAEERPNV